MRSLNVVRLDGPSGVVVEEEPEPTRGEGQVLVDVHAVGVSWPDLLMTRGEYQVKQEVPFRFGVDYAGVVADVPDGSHVKVGQRVAGTTMGCAADRIAAPLDLVFPLPDRLSFAEGAAMPMNYLTAHFALLVRAGLEEGETVMVNGAAGGVGTATIQTAKAFGAHVIAVVSTEAKGEVARAAGADDVVLTDGFLQQVRDLTDGRGVDVVIDVVGGDVMTDNLRALAPMGRVMVIGFAGGGIPQVKVNRLLLNNIDVRGVGWGAYALVRPGYARGQWTDLLPHIEDGLLTPPIGKVFPLEEAAQALTDMETRATLGKSVLAVR